MPLKDERPDSTSSGDDQGSDVESSERCDSMTSTSDLDCSRDSFTSDCSSKHCTPSSSPPKTLILDEVMDTARNLSNLSFAHEIAVNHNFHLELVNLPQDNLQMVVKNTVHKAFWDALDSKLNGDPPEYEHALTILEEIREILLSFLNPGANRMRTQIMEVLDMDVIRQQVDNNVVDIQGLASYIITTMGKMCAPIRDEEIKKLRENTDDVVTLFRKIFHVLDLMKMDAVNSNITCLRLFLNNHGVEYEREVFQRVVNQVPNALDRTTSWLKSALEDLSATMPTEQTKGQKGQRMVPGPLQVLNAASLAVLTWDYDNNPLPETWMNDELRLQEIQGQLRRCQMVNGVLLIVYSAVGGPIQGLPSLSERLKRMISVLLDGMHSPKFNMKEALEGVSAQICCEINKSLTERAYPALTPELQATLKGQICCITKQNNPIHILVEHRVKQYFTAVICDPKPQSRLEHVPAGLTDIKPELESIGAKFIALVDYNRRVYGPFYADIVRKLMFSSSPPAGELLRDTAHKSTPSN